MIVPPHEAPDSAAHLWHVVTPRTATASSTGSAQTILGAWSTRICRGNGSYKTGQEGQQMRGQKDSAQDTSTGGLNSGRLEEAGPTTLSCP